MYRSYAGIGSRETPHHVLMDMVRIAKLLYSLGYTLRSGGADGADSAFEMGADEANANRKVINPFTGDKNWQDGHPYKEIYLPWYGFNGREQDKVKTIVPQYDNPRLWSTAINMAVEIHPSPKDLTKGARSLHARNCYQVLGRDLATPVEFIICYTDPTYTRGGTRTAVKLGQSHHVPIWNLAISEVYDTVKGLIGLAYGDQDPFRRTTGEEIEGYEG